MFNIQWIPVNWDTLGLGHFIPVKWLPQIYEVAHKLSNKNTDFRLAETIGANHRKIFNI
jgi:hypothetical protein